MGLLEQHDIVLNEYWSIREMIKAYRDAGNESVASCFEFYTDGIAYVYSQIFQNSIKEAKPIGTLEATKFSHK